MNDNLLDGLNALFSNNSKQDISEQDKTIITAVMSKYKSEAPVEVVEEAPAVIEETVSEEVVQDKAPENNEVVAETLIAAEETEVGITEKAVEANIDPEDSNEIIETEDEQEYISKSAMTKLMNDFKADLLATLQGTVQAAPEVIEDNEPIGLTKGDPARHRVPKETSNVSKFMG